MFGGSGGGVVKMEVVWWAVLVHHWGRSWETDI